MIINVDGTERMLISEYMHKYKTILVDYEKAFAVGTAKDSIVQWYRNARFARGLAYDGNYIYEINGSIGKDIIYVLDSKGVITKRYFKRSQIAKISSPAWRTRDIGYGNGIMAMVDGDEKVIYTLDMNGLTF